MRLRNRASGPTRIVSPALALLVACGGEAATCLLYPCAVPEAIRISVAGAPGDSALLGLGMTANGAAANCTARICRVMGGPGTYQVTVSATGYVPKTMSVTVTGVAPGCNTCGYVDLQQLSVTLQTQG